MQSLSPEPLLSEEDYGAIEAAVMETARGRWFLAEYARRNRNADTDAVLSAIRRLERLVHSAGAFDTRDEVTRGMADIAQAIAAAQSSPVQAPSVLVPQALSVAVDTAPQEIAASSEPPSELASQVIAPAEIEADSLWLDAAVSIPEMVSSHKGLGIASEKTEMAAEEPETSDLVEEAGEAGLDILSSAVALPESGEVPVEINQLEAEGTDDAPAGTKLADAAPNSFAATAETQELFPIQELDEEATEALLTLDVPRQELILPTNHLATQRWHREIAVVEEEGSIEYRTDKWTMASGKSELPSRLPVATETPEEAVAAIEETSEHVGPAGLVTFVDEEPVEEEQSIFTAPLRLEPEATADQEAAPVIENRPATATAASSTPARVAAVRLTIGEIEAMPFARKAALFS